MSQYLRPILVVDDDPANSHLISEILSRDNCSVKVANSGDSALKILESYKPELVILDQDMPGLSGLETLRKIKELYPDLDVIFVSAHSNPQLVSQALETGADDYIRKPFSVIELLSRVHVRFRIRDLREELRQANQKLADLSQKDDLTGLYNMRTVYERVDLEIKRARRSGRGMAIVMMDMDHFKKVNDGHDHLFGSFVLKEMGKILAQTLREIDFAARYGGDEFLICLTETDERGVQIFCERLLQRVRNYLFKDGKDMIHLTLSLGYAMTSTPFDVSAKELVRVADHALYESKEAGRNRYTGYGPERTYWQCKRQSGTDAA